ncbi:MULTISPECIES: isocitrate/isopropylmalate dehydrogenase family protein [unclassified Halomonas]|uniref:isocitrate/isopropylmalate dehydrogenase family protein n=1 Tax=unclassified Halomonas TaxID=2609666 RepID=UPI00054FAADD|nr:MULTISPECIES: isocitrate/isopropylmalate dehydrogenase family protein [unclassified Halomonas]CEP35298.1 Isocitrate dehydrogenase [Halomonas sp. R57-5]
MDILVLPGDGIGPEITKATLSVLNHVSNFDCLGLTFDIREVGLKAYEKTGTTLPNDVMKRAREVEGIILAPLSTYEYPSRDEGGLNPSAEFRNRLHLFANYRPSKLRNTNKTYNNIDLVIVRENTEGFYASRSMHSGNGEFMPDANSAFALRKITADATRDIATAAYRLAQLRRKHVTIVHKANVLKLSDGLFLRTVREVSQSYPDVASSEVLVDAAAALLVRNPEQFDVILTTNMFGDILSNEAAELSGGLGSAPSLNCSHKLAMAQASHGSAPDIAGNNIANPSGLILSAAMLLEWLGRKHHRTDLVYAAEQIEQAIDCTLRNKNTRTHEMGGTLSTSGFAEAVIANYASENHAYNSAS